MPTSASGFGIPQIQPIQAAPWTKIDPNAGMQALLAVQKAIAQQQLMAARAAAAGGKGKQTTVTQEGVEYDPKNQQLVAVPKGDGTTEYVVTPKDVDTKNRPNAKAAVSKRLDDLASADPEFQETLKGFDKLSLKSQQEALKKMRTQDIPRMLQKWGVDPAMGSDLSARWTNQAATSMAAYKKNIDNTGVIQSGIDSLKSGLNRLVDTIKSYNATPEEQLVMQKAREAEDARIRASNPHLEDEYRMRQEGVASAGDFLDRPILNAAESLGDILGGAAGAMGAQMAGGAVGSAIGAGIGTLIAPGAGTAMGSWLGGLGGAALGGGAYGWQAGKVELADRLGTDPNLSDADKLRAIAEGGDTASAISAGIYGIPIGAGHLARSALARRAEQQAVKSATAGLTEQYGKTMTQDAIRQRAVEQARDASIANLATQGPMERYLRGLGWTSADLAALSGAGAIGSNYAYGKATGQDVPLLEGAGEAALAGAATGPLFGLFNLRRRTLPQARPAEDSRAMAEGRASEWKAPVPEETVEGGEVAPTADTAATAQQVLKQYYQDLGAASQARQAAPFQWETTPEGTDAIRKFISDAKQPGPRQREALVDGVLDGKWTPNDMLAAIASLENNPIEGKDTGAYTKLLTDSFAHAQAYVDAARMIAGRSTPLEAMPSHIARGKFTKPEALAYLNSIKNRPPSDILADIYTMLRDGRIEAKDLKSVLRSSELPANNLPLFNSVIDYLSTRPMTDERLKKYAPVQGTSRAGWTAANVAGNVQSGAGRVNQQNLTGGSQAGANSAQAPTADPNAVSTGAPTGNPAAQVGGNAGAQSPNPTEAQAPAGTAAGQSGQQPGAANGKSGGTGATGGGAGSGVQPGGGQPQTGTGNGRVRTPTSARGYQPNVIDPQFINEMNTHLGAHDALTPEQSQRLLDEVFRMRNAGEDPSYELARQGLSPEAYDKIKDQIRSFDEGYNWTEDQARGMAHVEEQAVERENNAGTPETIRIQPDDTIDTARPKLIEQLKNRGLGDQQAVDEAEVLLGLTNSLTSLQALPPGAILSRVNFSFNEPLDVQVERAIKAYMQEAWHGTPYEGYIDQLTTDMLGSGEGHQIHGWGLYVALLEETARERYQRRLSARRSTGDMSVLEVNGVQLIDGNIASVLNESMAKYPTIDYYVMRDILDEIYRDNTTKHIIKRYEEFAADATKSIKDSEETINKIKKFNGSDLEEVSYKFKGKSKDEAIAIVNEDIDLSRANLANIQDILKFIKESNIRIVEIPGREVKGQRLRLEIPEDGVMLREDKPLNEQPLQVRRAIDEIADELVDKYKIITNKRGPIYYDVENMIKEYQKFEKEYQYLSNAVSRDVNEFQKVMDDFMEFIQKVKQSKVLKIKTHWSDPLHDNRYKSGLIGELVDDMVTYVRGKSQYAPYKFKYIHDAASKIFNVLNDVQLHSVNLDSDYSYDQIYYIRSTDKTLGKDYYHSLMDIISGTTEEGDNIAWKMASKDVSLLLDKHGIKGIRYLGGLDGECAVLFDGKYIKILERFYDQQGRGRVDFLNDGTARILFGENADGSTAIHEFEHLYLNEAGRVLKDATVPDSRMKQQLAKDIETLGRWAGETDNVIDPWNWQTASHEKVAKAFEQYFREGKAPTPGLQGLFDRMARVLANLYRRAKDLLGLSGIPKKIREVFDRQLIGYGEPQGKSPREMAAENAARRMEQTGNTPPPVTEPPTNPKGKGKGREKKGPKPGAKPPAESDNVEPAPRSVNIDLIREGAASVARGTGLSNEQYRAIKDAVWDAVERDQDPYNFLHRMGLTPDDTKHIWSFIDEQKGAAKVFKEAHRQQVEQGLIPPNGEDVSPTITAPTSMPLISEPEQVAEQFGLLGPAIKAGDSGAEDILQHTVWSAKAIGMSDKEILDAAKAAMLNKRQVQAALKEAKRQINQANSGKMAQDVINGARTGSPIC